MRTSDILAIAVIGLALAAGLVIKVSAGAYSARQQAIIPNVDASEFSASAKTGEARTRAGSGTLLGLEIVF